MTGSTHETECPEQEPSSPQSKEEQVVHVLKDIDLLRRGRPFVLQSGDDEREELMGTIKADCDWLESHQLTEYSLVVGLSIKPLGTPRPTNRSNVSSYSLMLSADHDGDPNIVYLGIANIFTRWGLRQNVEMLFKGMVMRHIHVAPAPPPVHASRFVGFVGHIFVSKRTAWAKDAFEEEWRAASSKQEKEQLSKLVSEVQLPVGTATLVIGLTGLVLIAFAFSRRRK